MKKCIVLLLMIGLLASCTTKRNTYIITDSEALEELFSQPQKNIRVILESGDYHLTPEYFIDQTCGNCQDPNTAISATRGITISGKNVSIIGPSDRSAIIHTHAGYGIYIKDLQNGVLENLTITGTIRDTAQMATDAAIVVSNSDIAIRNSTIRDNLGDSLLISKHISGVMGICGRENSHMTIIGNEILRNSWDGIALYRDAYAEIIGNKIDGVDKSTGRLPEGGRGVAIGVTWNARAKIKYNYIARYWKGIGIFVDADCEVENNIVEDMVTWGIAFWDAGKGNPRAYISNNIIYNVGACGISITKSNEDTESGSLIGNIVVTSGQNEKYDSPDYYCYQTSLAMHKVPQNFEIKDNLFFDNRRATDDLPDYDIPKEQFHKKIMKKKSILYSNPFFIQLEFYKAFLYIYEFKTS